jgi:glycerol-3-phosphate acyltransferase PlsX
MSPRPDVIVTDGFTGNVALKSLEGAVRTVADMVFGVLGRDELKDAARVVAPALLEVAGELDPDVTGGALLLGVNGVCVISHGSSSARAIVNASRLARDCVAAGIVDRVKESIGRAG